MTDMHEDLSGYTRAEVEELVYENGRICDDSQETCRKALARIKELEATAESERAIATEMTTDRDHFYRRVAELEESLTDMTSLNVDLLAVADAAREACEANIVHEPCKAPRDIERIRRIHGRGDIKTLARLEDAIATLDEGREEGAC